MDKYTKFIYRGKVGVLILILLVGGTQFFTISDKLKKPDEAKVVASYLKENLDDDEIVFVANFRHIIYYLLERECPTKYVHVTILRDESLARAFGTSTDVEIKHILDKAPQYILIKNSFRLVQDLIRESYEIEKTFFEDKVLVYRRID